MAQEYRDPAVGEPVTFTNSAGVAFKASILATRALDKYGVNAIPGVRLQMEGGYSIDGIKHESSAEQGEGFFTYPI